MPFGRLFYPRCPNRGKVVPLPLQSTRFFSLGLP
jgi:hypothetical protein